MKEIELIKGDIVKHQELINQLQNKLREQEIQLIKKQGIIEYLMQKDKKEEVNK